MIKNQNKIEPAEDLIINYLPKIKNQKELATIKRVIAKKYAQAILLNSDILRTYSNLIKNKKILSLPNQELILRKRAIRTLSGIAPVAVLTKPYTCPGKCAYCPREKNVPVSYLSNEPAVMRAIRCNYNPYKQVTLRLKALESNGHHPEKIEIIVIGGTWSYLPEFYKFWYISECFRAANDFNINQKLLSNLDIESIKDKKTINFLVNKKIKDGPSLKLPLSVLKQKLLSEQKRNEKTQYKIIGLTLETRPDYINEKELQEMRFLGCTRVEMGVQAIDNNILKLNRRGHGIKEIILATKLLKQYGFKITYHIMPALPGSTPQKDLAMFKELFENEDYQPDQIKFYPTVVTKGSLLYRWYRAGKYQPYSDKELQELIINCKKIIPPYVRIIRLIRDIPSESIVAGNIITNLRQIMKNQGVDCNCIRCREAKEAFSTKGAVFKKIVYKSSGGTEYFLSFEHKQKKLLFGFCRLYINKTSPISPVIIRELHVYGELMPMGQGKKVQHRGLGKKLIAAAELIAKKEKCANIAIISGIGVRPYYRKMGYSLKNTYLIKKLYPTPKQ